MNQIAICSEVVMPYTKGIRDLYQIEVARVGTKHEFVKTADENDFRLVFEIKFVKQAVR